ncbi:hypothetical protein PV371_03260 [Streptomyces sp. TX20-6-3]|uniref:hypothetical protein n=1 Tax=Streptomyces sp. TX20-6-3 TaxID=3028705 RepID=UPI0029AFA222|nr:hypothetical protein [Streptomyces sp. TX20-6-3]MDX2558670.1 hypothetical protein [Streptomyces sp. TX20-6-3]
MNTRSTTAGRRRAGGAAKRRGAAAVALLALLTPPALAGCGIQKSDVVEAGGAATLHVGPQMLEERIVLYFVGPDGRSMPVTRDIGRPSPETSSPSGGSGEHVPTDVFGPGYEISRDDLRRGGIVTDKILAMLLAGPRENERAAGIATALPEAKGDTPTMLQASKGNGSTGTPARRLVWVRTPFPVKQLSEAGVRQLVCTTAYAEDPDGLVEVSLSGPDGILPTARCDD